VETSTQSRPELPTTGPSGPAPRRRRGGPFAVQAPAFVVAGAALLASQVWLVAGDALPGGRWLVVHMLTLGVLSPVVLVFSQHFAATLTRSAGEEPRWHAPAFALAAVGMLVALPSGTTWLLGSAATAATGVVMAAWWRIRRMRRQAVGARFGWVVRGYERAHGAFVHGAVLGALLGAFVLPGAWHASARLAHLHVMLLGWTGLTLLGTLVFFGPTMLRTRIVDGADGFAARWLPHAATGLSVGVVALLLTALPGNAGSAARLVAALGLALFATVATRVLWDVVEAALAARPYAVRGPMLAGCGWLVLVLWADVAVVATAAWQLLPTLGLLALAGVFVPMVLATLTHLAPLLRAATMPGRDAVRTSLERHAALRAGAYNTGVLVMVAAAVLGLGGADGTVLQRIGWLLLAGAVLHLLVAGMRPLPEQPVGDAGD